METEGQDKARASLRATQQVWRWLGLIRLCLQQTKSDKQKSQTIQNSEVAEQESVSWLAQQGRMFANKPEDLISIPRIHMIGKKWAVICSPPTHKTNGALKKKKIKAQGKVILQ